MKNLFSLVSIFLLILFFSACGKEEITKGMEKLPENSTAKGGCESLIDCFQMSISQDYGSVVQGAGNNQWCGTVRIKIDSRVCDISTASWTITYSNRGLTCSGAYVIEYLENEYGSGTDSVEKHICIDLPPEYEGIEVECEVTITYLDENNNSRCSSRKDGCTIMYPPC